MTLVILALHLLEDLLFALGLVALVGGHDEIQVFTLVFVTLNLDGQELESVDNIHKFFLVNNAVIGTDFLDDFLLDVFWNGFEVFNALFFPFIEGNVLVTEQVKHVSLHFLEATVIYLALNHLDQELLTRLWDIFRINNML